MSRSEPGPSSSPPSLPKPMIANDCGGAVDRFGRALPGDLQRFLQNHLGEKRQIVRHVHQRQDAAHLARRDAELMRLLERPQHLEFGLFAAALHSAQSRSQFGAQRLDVGNRVQQRRIEQFVEQHRMAAQLVGEPAAGAADLDQQSQRAGVFEQQHIVGRAPHRRFEQRHQPRQREVGVSGRLRFIEQLRNQRVEPRATFAADPRPIARGAQPADQRRNCVELAETRPPPAPRPSAGTSPRATARCQLHRPSVASSAWITDSNAARHDRALLVERVTERAQNRRNPCRPRRALDRAALVGSSCVCSSRIACSRCSTLRRNRYAVAKPVAPARAASTCATQARATSRRRRCTATPAADPPRSAGASAP